MKINRKNLIKVIVALVAFFALITALAYCNQAKAQEQEQLPMYVPDRPGIGYNAYSIGIGHFAYEASFGMIPDYIYMTNTVRYQAVKHLELRFGMDLIGSDRNIGEPKAIRGCNIGIKMPLWEGVKWLPDAAVIATVVLPNTGDPNYAPTHYVPVFTVALQKSVGNFIFIGNAGMFSDAFTKIGNYSYLNPYSINEKIQGSYSFAVNYIIGNTGIFCETYGFYGNDIKPYAAIDFGGNYVINPNFIVDASMSLNYVTGLKSSFINFGFGWRIHNN
jgi:hypothetical protein